MSDDRTATEVWADWFAERRGTWFGLGDAGAAPYCQCEAAISADSATGERQAFLFRTFGDVPGWFMVLDSYDGPDRPRRTAQVEWINDCEGLLHGVTRLADFVATLVPDLADAGCPGLTPDGTLIGRMGEIERRDIAAAFERGRASYRAEVEAAIRAEIEWWNSEPATKELSDTEVGLISTALSSVGAKLPATEEP